MIVREESDGSLLLIAQTDHSRLSGTFAAHWGNKDFDRPRPYEAAVRAANFHDCGWYRYETSPRLNEETGKTPNFMQVPLDREQLDAFQWGSDWLTDIDPYAGLLINRHRTGLWRGRYGAIRYPEAFNAKNLSETVEQFIADNERRQKSEMTAFDEKEFLTNYQLLQVWDLLSLYFCVREIKEDSIDPVPTRYAEGPGSGVRMTVQPIDAVRVSIDPYPFDVPRLAFSVLGRRFPTTTFPSQAAFREAYYKCEPERIPFDLVPA